MKSCLSGVTHIEAPESQMMVKLSLGSMAALQATGCCGTTDSDSRQLHGQVSVDGGSSAGCGLRVLCNVLLVLYNVLVSVVPGVLDRLVGCARRVPANASERSSVNLGVSLGVSLGELRGS